MANTIDTIKKNDSLHVYNGMIVVYPLLAQEEPLDISYIVEFDNCYAINNSVICYVMNYEVYVTPYHDSTIKSLEEAGFSEKSFYVPFSNFSYPKVEKQKWNMLCER